MTVLLLAHWWHSPVLWRRHVYAVDQAPAAIGSPAGALFCYHIATGELKWSAYDIGGDSRPTLTKGGKLLIAGGKLILLNDYGGLIMAEPVKMHLIRREVVGETSFLCA